MNRPLPHFGAFTLALLSLQWAPISAALASESFKLSEHTTDVRSRPESVQWIPESVTVISKAEIEATYRRNLESLQAFVPGMIHDSLGSTPQGGAIGIRGIQSNRSSKVFEPAVAVSIDGVYVGTHTGQSQVIFDFEKVEIARGAQGTFNSAPAQAGAINITRTKPTGEHSVVTRIGFRDFNRVGADIVYNNKIRDGLAAKITGSFLSGEDSDTSGLNGRDENEEDRSSLSFSVLWDQRDDVSVQYTFDIEEDTSNTAALANLSTATDLVCVPRPQDSPIVAANCGGGGRTPESGDLKDTLQNASNTRSFDGQYHTLNIEGEYQNYKITSITGFRSTKEDYTLDLDATSPDFYTSVVDQDYEQFSTDFRILSQWNEKVTVMIGGYLLNMSHDLDRSDQFILDQLINAELLPASTLPGQTRVVDSKLESSLKSFFIHADYARNESWRFDGGFRINNFTKNFDHNTSALATTTSAGTALVVNEDDSWFEVSASAGISYKVDELAMVYAHYSVDHIPGGYNDNAVSVESASYEDTESTTSIEIGMKSDWLDDTLRLNMAFYQNYQDEKLEEFSNRATAGVVAPNLGNIESKFGNISELEVRGFDLEFEYVPTDNLYFRGAYGHMNSSYQHYRVPDLANPGTELELHSSLVSARAPTDTYFLSSQYLLPFQGTTINLFAGYRYVTSYITNPLVFGGGKVRPFTTWDLSATFEWENVSLRLFSQNVNDKRYLINANTSFASQVASLSSGLTTDPGISTYAEVNRPQYSGIEVMWSPKL